MVQGDPIECLEKGREGEEIERPRDEFKVFETLIPAYLKSFKASFPKFVLPTPVTEKVGPAASAAGAFFSGVQERDVVRMSANKISVFME